MDMDTAVPMFSGDKEISFPSGYDNDAKVMIRQKSAIAYDCFSYNEKV